MKPLHLFSRSVSMAASFLLILLGGDFVYLHGSAELNR